MRKDDPLQRLNDEDNWLKQELAEQLHLPKAKQGEWWAIRYQLSIIANALNDGSPLTPQITSWLVEALRKIAAGKDHKDAFNIRRGRGKRDTRKANGEAFLNAYRVEYYRAQGLTLLEAKGQVVEDTNVKEGTLDRQWAKHHQMAKHEIEMQKRCFGKTYPVDGME